MPDGGAPTRLAPELPPQGSPPGRAAPLPASTLLLAVQHLKGLPLPRLRATPSGAGSDFRLGPTGWGSGASRIRQVPHWPLGCSQPCLCVLPEVPGRTRHGPAGEGPRGYLREKKPAVPRLHTRGQVRGNSNTTVIAMAVVRRQPRRGGQGCCGPGARQAFVTDATGTPKAALMAPFPRRGGQGSDRGRDEGHRPLPLPPLPPAWLTGLCPSAR